MRVNSLTSVCLHLQVNPWCSAQCMHSCEYWVVWQISGQSAAPHVCVHMLIPRQGCMRVEMHPALKALLAGAAVGNKAPGC